MVYLKLLLFFGRLRMLFGCFGGGPYYYYGYGSTTPSSDSNGPTTTGLPPLTSSEEQLKRIVSASFGGFDIPPKTIEALQKWMKDVKEKQDFLNLHNDSGLFEKDRGKDSGWPFEWGGLGAGHPGFPPDPPPIHAYRPTNIKGVPPYCFVAPDKGNCNKIKEMWYYHPYLDQCYKFNYTGCGGNKNRHDSELQCIQVCMTEPGVGCDTETNIFVEAYGILEDRRRKASDPSQPCKPTN